MVLLRKKLGKLYMLTKKRKLMGPLSPKYYHNEPVIILATYWDASHIHIPFVGYAASYTIVVMPTAPSRLSQSFPHTITNTYSGHPTVNKSRDEGKKDQASKEDTQTKEWWTGPSKMEIKLALKETS